MFEQLDYTASLSKDCPPFVSVLRAMEAAARIHTTQLGIDRPHMLKTYGAVWMIARCYLHLDDPITLSMPLTVRTWHRGMLRGIVYRDYDLYQDGRQIGEAVQTWVLVDSIRRILIRMDKLPELQEVPHPGQMKTLQPPKPIPSQPFAEASSILPDRNMLDENGHINNANYVALALNALSVPVHDVRTLALNYHRECFAGEPLPCARYQNDREIFIRLFTPEGNIAFDLLAQ